MGVWGSPQTVSGCAQGAAGTVAGKICDDVGHGVNKYIIAAARDGTNKDLILTCEWFATRLEYFDGLNANRTTKKLGGGAFLAT